MHCPGCGFECLPEFAFCPKCGSQLVAPQTESAPEGDAPPLAERIQRLLPMEFADQLLVAGDGVSHERRTVTLLFCDVKGSTAMAESLDPEDVLEIMNGAFEVLIEPVLRYEGTLARLMGDAILAFFGAPTAHEDDPERACRAALEIVAGAQAYAAQLEADRGIVGFNVRVGIHTGLVVVGEVGSDQRAEYTAMGDAVNLAARMEQAAAPGTILISEATHTLVAPLFETEALGPVSVKGKAEPVPVYRVLATREGAVKPRGIPGLASPLVGRKTEIAALREALARLRGGEGGIVTVVGEAGIGKSRLVAELRKQVEAQRAAPLQWIEGRCLSYGSSIAYLLCLDVLRDLLGVTTEDSPETVRDALRRRVRDLCPDRFDELYPFLGRLLSLPLEPEIEAGFQNLEGRELKASIYHAVETLLAQAASRQPLVLVCEDLHWADTSSVDILQYLLALSDRVPLLFLCITRPVRDHPSWQLRETIARDHGPHQTDLCLVPLSSGESGRLVSNLLWLEELPSELTERILDRAEGNPFFLEEVLRSLIDSGAIVEGGADGHWQAARDVAAIEIPDTLHGVLAARIDRLQEETRRVLQLASVIGRIFLYRVLADMAKEEQKLDGQLLTLEQEEMIRERARLPELEYIFKHDLTREVAYNGLLKRDRRVYHRQVAESLERLFPGRLDEQVGLLAHHWERAGDLQKAFEYHLLAGDAAWSNYARQEATDHFERAEDLVSQVPAATIQHRISLHRGLGLTRDSLQAATQHYQVELQLIQDHLNPDESATRRLMTETMLRTADAYLVSYPAEGERWLARAFDTLGAPQDREETILTVRLLRMEALLASMKVEPSRTLESARKALALAEPIADPQLERLCLHALSHGLATQCRFQETLEVMHRMQRINQQFRTKWWDWIAYDMLCYIYWQLGELEKAREAAAEMLSAAPVHGATMPLAAPYTNWTVGLIHLEMGHLEEAESWLRDGMTGLEKLGNLAGVVFEQSLCFLGVAYRRRGRLDEARAYLDKGIALYRDTGRSKQFFGLALTYQAELYLDLGHLDKAVEILEESLAREETQCTAWEEGMACRVLGRAYRLKGNLAGAERYVVRSIERHEQLGSQVERGRSLYEVGLLRRELGDEAGARLALQQAREIFETKGASHDLAKVQEILVP